MRLRKEEFSGTGKVFSFTFFSLMKSKGNIVAMVVFALIGLLSVPALLLTGGGQMVPDYGSSLSGLVIYNQTELLLEENLTEENYFDGSFPVEVRDQLPGEHPTYGLSPRESSALITQTEDGSYQIRLYAGMDTELSSSDLEQLEGSLEQMLQEEHRIAGYRESGLSEDQIRLLTASYQVETESVTDYLDETEAAGEGGYVIQLVYAIVVLMVSMMAAGYIVRAVAEEKSSKLVEMLLLDVRPLALLAGKILASLAYTFSLLILFLVCVLISCGVSSRLFGIPGPVVLLQTAAGQLGLEQLSAGIIPALILSLLLGCLTFALISGISGAGCSSMEDLSGASTAAVFLAMGGYFVSIAAVNIPSRGVELFTALCPVLSVYCGPIQYALGNISFGLLAVSWAVQVLVVLLLALFCARIYRDLIMYKGNRLTWIKMIKIARNTKGKGGAA